MLLKIIFAVVLLTPMVIIGAKAWSNRDVKVYYDPSKIIVDSSGGKTFFHVQNKLGL